MKKLIVSNILIQLILVLTSLPSTGQFPDLVDGDFEFMVNEGESHTFEFIKYDLGNLLS